MRKGAVKGSDRRFQTGLGEAHGAFRTAGFKPALRQCWSAALQAAFGLVHGVCQGAGCNPALRYSAGWKPALQFVCAILFCCSLSLRADIGIEFSGNFLVDTRYGFSTGSSGSGNFRIDTRFSGSASDAVSGLFTVDTLGAAIGNATITGTVKDQGGTGLAGTAVFALQNSLVRAQVFADANGAYQLSALPAGTYELRALKVGYVLGLKHGRSVDSGQTLTVGFALEPMPGTPATTPVTTPPEPKQIRANPPPTSEQLKMFVNGGFQSGIPLDPTKMVIIMTHGWKSKPDEWAKLMAERMTGKGIQTNIVAWDWEDMAVGIEPPADETQRQGLALGKALYQALGSDYSQKVHFLGHSLGTLVNGRAANFLHGDGERESTRASPHWLAYRTHMTLFDEAELASVFGQNVLYTAAKVTLSGVAAPTGAAAVGVALYENWRSPIPRDFAWMDNYITAVGIHHRKAVNVYLRYGAVRAGFDVTGYHSYPMDWYGKSVDAVDSALSVLMGYRISFERLSVVPPEGNYSPNTVYVQPLLPQSELALNLLTENTALTDILLLQSRNVAITVVSVGVTAVNGTVNFVGNVAAGAVIKILENYEGTLNPFADPVGITTPQTIGISVGNFDQQAAEGSLEFRFRTSPPIIQAPSLSGVRRNDTGGATNTPAYAWMPLDVPPNTVFFSFDYTLTGDGKNDYIAAGVNGTNVFKMEAGFTEDGVPSNSGLINISRYAGTTVEFFFGLLGGTSTNGVLSVDGIRFHQLTPPALAMAQAGNQTLVTWPYSAPGYVLESIDQLGGTNVWSVLATNASVVDFRYTVTNNVSPVSRFFRLRKQ